MPHVFDTMGTVVSLDCPALAVGSAELASVMAIFAGFDDRFSLYKSDSELSAIARGNLSLTSASAELRELYARAIDWRNRTGGEFSPHRPDGVIDLNGIVKAVAMQSAADSLRGFGVVSWCLNVGGDVFTDGSQGDGSPWTVGIVDPLDRSSLLCAVTLGDERRAIATSGSAERGAHIWSKGVERSDFVQVSVVAAKIETADVLATAIIAGGVSTLNSITENYAVDVLTVDSKGSLTATPGFAPG